MTEDLDSSPCFSMYMFGGKLFILTQVQLIDLQNGNNMYLTQWGYSKNKVI